MYPFAGGYYLKGCSTWKSYIAMENGPFEDVFPIKNGDIPLLC